MTNAKKRIYISLIGLSVVGLTVDRVFLSDRPEPAGAATIDTGSARAVNPTAAGAGAVPQIVVAPFPHSLADADLHELRDPFSLPDEIRQQLIPAKPAENAHESGDEPSEPEFDVQAFASQHELSAVMRVNQQWAALIDGQMVKVGQQVGPCTLSAIAETAVTLTCGPTTLKLTIEDPLGNGD